MVKAAEYFSFLFFLEFVFFQVDEAIKLYHMLCREEKELPQDLVNHFLGLCAFYKGSSSQVELLDWDPCKVRTYD